jgi:hypothetical protein
MKIKLKWKIDKIIERSGLSIEDFCRMLEVRPSFFRSMLYKPETAAVKLVKLAHLMRILQIYLGHPVRFEDLISVEYEEV